jgi:hypothetical protein
LRKPIGFRDKNIAVHLDKSIVPQLSRFSPSR